MNCVLVGLDENSNDFKNILRWTSLFLLFLLFLSIEFEILNSEKASLKINTSLTYSSPFFSNFNINVQKKNFFEDHRIKNKAITIIVGPTYASLSWSSCILSIAYVFNEILLIILHIKVSVQITFCLKWNNINNKGLIIRLSTLNSFYWTQSRKSPTTSSVWQRPKPFNDGIKQIEILFTEASVRSSDLYSTGFSPHSRRNVFILSILYLGSYRIY